MSTPQIQYDETLKFHTLICIRVYTLGIRCSIISQAQTHKNTPTTLIRLVLTDYSFCRFSDKLMRVHAVYQILLQYLIITTRRLLRKKRANMKSESSETRLIIHRNDEKCHFA